MLTHLMRDPARDGMRKEHWEDVEFLHSELRENGYDASLADVSWAWQQYSKDVCEDWARVHYSSSGYIRTLRQYLVPSQ